MAEQPTELRQINWSECFSFTHIFRTFRMAIHPGKLGLALLGLVVMTAWGCLLDLMWRGSDSLPLAGEVNAYWQVPDIGDWREVAKKQQGRALWQLYGAIGEEPPEKAEKAHRLGGDRSAITEALEKLEKGNEDAIDAREKDFKGEDDRKLKEEDERRIKAEVLGQRSEIHAAIKALEPDGPYWSFLKFERGVVRQLIDAARGLNFTGEIDLVMSARSTADGMTAVPDPDDAMAAFGGMGMGEGWQRPLVRYPMVKSGPEGVGVLACVVLMLRGMQWLVVTHWLFAILFLVVSLGIWSLVGGAICRIAALNVARDERMSPKAALAFSRKKFLGFLTAPLLPIGLILVIGVCLFAGGLFMAIPVVGDLLGGLGMGLALVGGFVMALVAVGAIAGVGLMWPTVAVEGSDSFDAMSRSYSYVYGRPWRAGFYAAVAVVYGALCYLFARFFVLALLKLTRFFVGLGMTFFGTIDSFRPGTGQEGARKIDAIWPHATFEELLATRPPFGAEGFGDKAAGGLVWLWVMLLALLLCAFLVSFFLSGSTVIYYLLRKKVDATDMEDVYLEEDEEEEEAASMSSTATAEAGGQSTPAPEPPPVESPEKPAEDSGGSEGSGDDSGGGTG